jgi:hypothetical protein
MLRRLVLATVVATFGVPLATALPVAASAPIVNEHERFSDTFEDELCGISGTSTINVVDNFKLFADGTFSDTSVFRLVFTADNGNSVTVLAAGQITGPDEPIENEDGTVTFIVTIKGLPEKLSISGGPTLSLDAGAVTLATTFSVDANGNLNFDSHEFSGEHGPQPDLASDFELFCEVVIPALTA